jgi:hypothetical protein
MYAFSPRVDIIDATIIFTHRAFLFLCVLVGSVLVVLQHVVSLQLRDWSSFQFVWESRNQFWGMLLMSCP